MCYGFFSGQPLTICGPTGPVLVFETIIYEMCKSWEWDYLPFRLCIGLWVGIILLICVVTDASAVVCYITRFTEENFALLIAAIFIKSAIQKVMALEGEFPLKMSGDCFCDPIGESNKTLYGNTIKNFVSFNETFSYNKYKCEVCSHPNMFNVRLLIDFFFSFYRPTALWLMVGNRRVVITKKVYFYVVSYSLLELSR